MRGYQSIPSAAIDAIENGGVLPTTTTTTASEDDVHPSHCPSRSTISSPPPALSSRYAIKVGLVAIGIVVGCIGTGFLAWREDPSPLGRATPSSGTTTTRHDDIHDSFVIRGKSFYDSLPFEAIVPNALSSLGHMPGGPRGREGTTTSASSHPSSPMMDGTNVDVLASILGSPSSSGGMGGGATQSSVAAAPHILYHATPTAFGLLYDPSRSSYGYLSEYALDYFLINSGGFDAQDNQAYCAVASVSTLLNSLRYSKRFRDGDDPSGWSFDLPTDPRYDPYPYATQSDVLSGECVRDNVIERGEGSGNDGGTTEYDGIFRPPYGLSLEQAGKLLTCHSHGEWIVTVVNVDPSQVSLLRMRYDLKAALIDPDARAMINYDRKGLGQVGGGHFSPLGAYHASTDSFLVMDVAKYKYPPVWVGADTLYAAMATVDRCGTYDYPRGQERLIDTDGGGTGTGNALFDPATHDEYEDSLRALNCKERMRGYIILKKRGSSVN